MTNYKYLAIGILKQAAIDYQTALITSDTDKINYLEKWFVSDYAQMLSDDMGEVIIKKCREAVNLLKEEQQ